MVTAAWRLRINFAVQLEDIEEEKGPIC